MMKATRWLLLCSVFASTAIADNARAQLLWNALDSKPKANMVIGYDTSTTMQIDPGCTTGCHATWGGWSWAVIPWSQTRLYGATTELANTLTLFKDQFVYGGFRYDTCGGTYRGHDSHNSGNGWAEVNYAVQPNVANVTGSYNNVMQMINDIRNQSDAGPVGPTSFAVCEHAEGYLPGGYLIQPNCFTPTVSCSGDPAWGQLVLSNPPAMIQGLHNIPPVPSVGSDMPCDLPGPPTLNATLVLGGAMSGAWTVPHYTSKPSPGQVQNDVCDPLDLFFSQLYVAMHACQSSQAVIDAYFDMNFYTAHSQSYWCNSGEMHDKICNTWSGGVGSPAMDNSCVCNPNQNNCLAGGNSSCGVPYTFKARQQVAVCEAYDPASFGGTFAGQADNVVNGQCRQNVSLFFTDGLWGANAGVALEAANAISNVYASTDVPPLSNAFVFKSNNPVDGRFAPDTMASYLGLPAAFDATNQTSLDISFAEVVNRVQKGVYHSANMAYDTYGTRVAVTSFTVPGHPNPVNPAIPDETYIGRPTRISWFSVNPATGALSASPICETDWATRAGYPGMGATYYLSHVPLTGAIKAAIGPPTGGQTWASGAPMYAWLPRGAADRDGDGVGGQPGDMTVDNLAYGFMLNGGPTKPVVVEQPHDPPSGANAALFAQYETSAGSPIAHRPRMIYTMAGGYLFGFNGGTYWNHTRSINTGGGTVNVNWDYDDSGANACREVFRYLPQWVTTDPNFSLTTRVPQTLTAGQIAVREVQLASAGTIADFGTLLVMTQGAGGRNMAALEVTDPLHSTILAEWSLPNAADTTTAEPTIYEFPKAVGTQPVVVMPGGAGGSARLYSYSISRATGATLLSNIALPADQYPSSAICFDGIGRGSVSDCVLVGLSGTLVRVPVDRNGRFTAGVVNLTGSYAPLRIAGEQFWTHPAVYFDNSGNAHYVFGSGDIKNLSTPPSVANQVYRVVDRYNRSGLPATTNNICVADGSGSKTGLIHLGPGEVMTSPPIVARGVVTFTSFVPGANGCTAGNSYVYAMNYETCKDALSAVPPLRPVGQAIGQGIPMSPSYLRGSDTILTQTSNGTVNAVSAGGRGVGTLNKNHSGLVPLYWRTELKSL